MRQFQVRAGESPKPGEYRADAQALLWSRTLDHMRNPTAYTSAITNVSPAISRILWGRVVLVGRFGVATGMIKICWAFAAPAAEAKALCAAESRISAICCS